MHIYILYDIIILNDFTFYIQGLGIQDLGIQDLGIQDLGIQGLGIQGHR